MKGLILVLYSDSLYMGGHIFRRNFASAKSKTYDAEGIKLGKVLAGFLRKTFKRKQLLGVLIRNESKDFLLFGPIAGLCFCQRM